MKRKCQTTMHTNDKGPFHLYQAMTEAKHNRPIPKLFDNRPSASAAKVFYETIGLIIQNIFVFFLATKLKISLAQS